MSSDNSLAALQYRNCRLSIYGQLASLLGTWMQTIARAAIVGRIRLVFGILFVARIVQFARQLLTLTTYDSDGDILHALEAGATGCQLKDAPREDIFRAIKAAAQCE